MAEMKVLICDWCKADDRTTLAAEVVQVRRNGTPFNLALCGAHVSELLIGATKATRGARRGIVASDLVQKGKRGA
jgi:hypothetical protein